VGVIPEEHLDGYAGDGARTFVGDVSVEVGNFASGEAGRLTHGHIGDGQAGRVRILSGRDGSDAGRGLAALEDKEHYGCKDKDNRGSNRHGQPVTLPGFSGADEFEIRWSAHERILHPLPKENAAEQRSDL